MLSALDLTKGLKDLSLDIYSQVSVLNHLFFFFVAVECMYLRDTRLERRKLVRKLLQLFGQEMMRDSTRVVCLDMERKERILRNI